MDLEKKVNKNLLKKTDRSVTVLLLIGILIVVNFFSYNIFHRFDLTENKVYSISGATKRMLSELDDIVNIRAYFSDNLPTQLLSLRQEVEDVLAEYSAYSGGKIKVEFIDPGEDEAMQQELYLKGIPQLTFEVVEKDKRQLQNGYLGLDISYGANSEVIPTLRQNISDLEYQLTTKIKKVTSDEVAVLGYLTTQGTTPLDQAMTLANEKLRELYSMRMVSLTKEEPFIDEDIKTLIIVGPKEDFNEDQLKAINGYLASGGSVIALIDGINIGEGLSTIPVSTGISGLFSDYGLTINPDLVADQRSGMASFSQGFFSFSTPYPFWPKVNSDGFDSDYSAVSGLENVVFPWASSISIDEAKLSGADVTKLVITTDRSWTQKDQFQIIPNQIPSPSQGLQKHNLAVAVNGEVDNPYAESEENAKFSTRIILLSDSDFVSDNFIGNNPDNLNLFLNLVDSLSLDDDLIEIRSKTSTSRPIDDANLNDAKRSSLRYLNVFGITAVVLIFGIFRYYLRRKSSFVDEL